MLSASEEGGAPLFRREAMFYLRGVARLKMGQGRAGLADVNRALVINSASYRVRREG